MQLVLEQEQEDLRASVRAFAREEAPHSVLRAVADGDRGPVPAAGPAPVAAQTEAPQPA